MPKPTGPQFDPIELMDERGSKRSFKALYHGTPNPIPEGEDVLPVSLRHPEGLGRKTVMATPSLAVAKKFAQGDQGTGYIYQVEPLDREDMESTWYQPIPYWRKGSIEVPSRRGFRILRQVHPSQLGGKNA